MSMPNLPLLDLQDLILSVFAFPLLVVPSHLQAKLHPVRWGLGSVMLLQQQLAELLPRDILRYSQRLLAVRAVCNRRRPVVRAVLSRVVLLVPVLRLRVQQVRRVLHNPAGVLDFFYSLFSLFLDSIQKHGFDDIGRIQKLLTAFVASIRLCFASYKIT
jgi:hypothetical protein